MENYRGLNRGEISEGRKIVYHAGAVVSVIGIILFFSFFFSIAMNFFYFDRGYDHHIGTRMGWAAIRLFSGFILILAGGAMRGVGAMGLAGSGVVLDPAQARQDVKPWTKMAGGMVNDAVNEIEIVKEVAENLGEHHQEEGVREVIKVRCPQCQALNDEDAKFCDQCGGAMR